MTESSYGISNTLQSQFEDWRNARGPQEQKFLNFYQDAMRIDRTDDTKGTGIARANKASIFIGSTRGKIRSARAKINDVLFGQGKMPFDTTPTNEDLRQFSDAMEDILAWQMDEGDFKKSIKAGVDSLGVYGTSFMLGPFVKNREHSEVKAENMGGYMAMREDVYQYPCPYYELARTMDVYPDPDASCVQEGKGVYWSARKDKHFIRELKKDHGYSAQMLDMALGGCGDEETQGSDLAEQMRGNLSRYTQDGRIWYQRYFGLVSRKALEDWRAENAEQEMEGEEEGIEPEPAPDYDDEMIEVIAEMAAGYVIRIDENPYKHKRRPIARCVYEDVEGEMYGVGIAENNEPTQRVTNAAFRLYIEGKAYALLKTGWVDRSKFSTKEDFKRFPGKLYDLKPNLTADERKDAMGWYDTIDVTDGWERVIQMCEDFSDQDTGITKYSQGTDSSNLNKTATGISMIMNASSLPMKEVISHVDEMWIEETIEALIDWDMEFLEPETVAKMVGQKQAEAWAQIKELGKTSFMEWRATGSQTFMAKEVLMNKLQGFLQLVLSGGEVTIPNVDIPELLRQVWDAGEVGQSSPVLDEETLKQRKEAQKGPDPMQLAQQQAEMQDKLDAAKDDRDAELKIALQHMDERSRKDVAELNGMIAIIMENMKQGAANQAQTAAISAAGTQDLLDDA